MYVCMYVCKCMYLSLTYFFSLPLPFSLQVGESVEVQEEQDIGTSDVQQHGGILQEDGQDREQNLQQWLEEDEDRRQEFFECLATLHRRTAPRNPNLVCAMHKTGGITKCFRTAVELVQHTIIQHRNWKELFLLTSTEEREENGDTDDEDEGRATEEEREATNEDGEIEENAIIDDQEVAETPWENQRQESEQNDDVVHDALEANLDDERGEVEDAVDTQEENETEDGETGENTQELAETARDIEQNGQEIDVVHDANLNLDDERGEVEDAIDTREENETGDGETGENAQELAETAARDIEEQNGQEIDVVHDNMEANLDDERGEVEDGIGTQEENETGDGETGETARDMEEHNGQEIDVVHDVVEANLYNQRGEVEDAIHRHETGDGETEENAITDDQHVAETRCTREEGNESEERNIEYRECLRLIVHRRHPRSRKVCATNRVTGACTKPFSTKEELCMWIVETDKNWRSTYRTQ